MSTQVKDEKPRFGLPLIPAAEVEPHAKTDSIWDGWTPVTAPDSPLPVEPQGDYATTSQTPLELPQLEVEAHAGPVELLAPAGGPEAGFAAFHYGADAIYLGLQKFSARAEAENYTLEEVGEITAYAHALTPRRRVFVTINTLIRQDELGELVEDIAALAEIGVDALIVQDLGVYCLVREHFPTLELHASTQLSVHNRAGAEALHRLGFERVVLARELTFEEVRDITAAAGLETEVFIHGALCYSYSGLCLFSSQTLGRSGNRGKCAYSCRDAFQVTGAPLTLRDGNSVRRNPQQGFPFSMKDLALPDHIPALRAAGVSCFKIEGRKKSPLYVATTTDYYRKLLDGRLSQEDRPEHEAEMQTVFSRPWTRLFVQSHKDKEVADRDTVGHRGTPIGRVERVIGTDGPSPRLRFRTSRALERHDGLQVDLPQLGKPFGFAVENLWVVSKSRSRTGRRQGALSAGVFQAEAGSLVEVSLPREHPVLPVGATVYCSSSQAVKQKYRHDRPKPEVYRVRQRIVVECLLTQEALTASAMLANGMRVNHALSGPFENCRDCNGLFTAARGAFERLGDTPFELESLTFSNDACLFVPVSKLNQLRRELVTKLENRLLQTHSELVAGILQTVLPKEPSASKSTPTSTRFAWSLKVDRLQPLEALESADWNDLDELVVDIARDHPVLLQERLALWEQRLGRERIRLALPPLIRAWEDKGIRHKISQLLEGGWKKWEAGNLSAWTYLGVDPLQPQSGGLDLATDWSVYVLNRLAVKQVLAMGATRFALSPEDGLANFRSLLAEFAEQAVVIVYQDTPLFLAESCAYANLIGGCPGKANCCFESMEMESVHGEKVTALDYHCRTIVLNQGPFCLSPRLEELRRAGAKKLRADFIYRGYDPTVLRDRWRMLRAGRSIPGGHSANFDRGVL